MMRGGFEDGTKRVDPNKKKRPKRTRNEPVFSPKEYLPPAQEERRTAAEHRLRQLATAHKFHHR